MFDVKAHLKTLVETHAPSGYEGPIREVLRQEWAGLVDTMETDKLGSLIGIKRATQPLDPPRRIMLAAHMDEIGLMVRDVVDGFIYVHRISGVDNRIMPSQPVIVHGKRPLPGIVASVPPHLLTADQRQKYPSFDELIIDVGLPAAEVAELVQHWRPDHARRADDRPQRDARRRKSDGRPLVRRRRDRLPATN